MADVEAFGNVRGGVFNDDFLASTSGIGTVRVVRVEVVDLSEDGADKSFSVAGEVNESAVVRYGGDVFVRRELTRR